VIGIKFFVGGRWITVCIDYMLPCIQDGDGVWLPVFCRPETDVVGEKELWCCCEWSPAHRMLNCLLPAGSRDDANTCALCFSDMEKAYAKLMHSYYATATGECSDALNYLTGGLVSSVPTESAEAWNALSATIIGGAFASSACKDSIPSGTLEGVGLLHGHAYSLLHTYEDQRSGLRLVNLKNPW
jgi:hypothetical protein